MAVAGPLSAFGAAALPAVVGEVLGDRLPTPGNRGLATLAAAAGVLTLVVTGLSLYAAHAGMLSIAAVLASLYPGVTVALRPSCCTNGRTADRCGLVVGAVAVTLIVLT